LTGRQHGHGLARRLAPSPVRRDTTPLLCRGTTALVTISTVTPYRLTHPIRRRLRVISECQYRTCYDDYDVPVFVVDDMSNEALLFHMCYL
jgi:hypothetical protein